MKKVGILTMNGNHNYGNRLQNYALQEILKRKGYEVETIVIPRLKHINEGKLYKKIYRAVKNPKGYWNRRIESKQSVKKLKEAKISPFTTKYLNTRVVKLSDKVNLNDGYDFFIVGSDQVWNPNFYGQDSTNFLDFADPKKRIAYAASFGVSSIEGDLKSFYKNNLSKIDNISVRESSGEKIIKDLIGKSVPVVIDPTMLLSKLEWLNLVAGENNKLEFKEDYILIYTLRDVSTKIKNKITEYAKKNNLRIVSIMGDLHQEDAIIPTITEFIELISNAQLVVTDSFHGTVFSILLETPFITLERNGGNMESRLLTLLNKFDFMSNYYTDQLDIETLLNQTRFDHVLPFLNQEQKSAIKFLESSLK